MAITRIFIDFRHLTALAICILALVLPGVANAAEAGKFQFVIGDIKVISASGAERVPVKGEAFNSGETIVTGASGTAQIRMSDGGLVAVRPDTQLKLDQYVFNGREDGSERKLVSLIKGGFRAITGLIGNRNKENYKILTPSATIGIRGTDHEAVVITTGAAGGFQAGTYDRVYRGATIIETEKGKLIVNPNQVGFTPGKGAAPVLLPKIPEFFDSKAQRPDVSKDPQKDAKGSDSSDTKTNSAKDTGARSRSTLKNELGTVKDTDLGKDATTTLRSPLDSATVKDIGTTTPTTLLKDSSVISPLKTEALVEPLVVPTTTLKSTDLLTAPTTTTSTTLKSTSTTLTSPTTTTISPITTTTPIAPITTTTTRIAEPVIAPTTTTTTTTILKSPTTTIITK